MAVNPTIILRVGGSPLSNYEIDTNFTNIKDAIITVSGQVDNLATFESNQTTLNSSVNSTLTTHQTEIDALAGSIAGVGVTLDNYVKRDGSLALTGNLSGGGFLLTDVGTPIDSTDAANKNYVDQSLSLYFKLDGSQALSGNLNASGFTLTNVNSPSNDGDAANKLYVDSSILDINLSPYFKRDGSNSPTADINFDGHKIINLHTPQNSGDAANKEYVDDRVSCMDELSIALDNADIFAADTAPLTFAYNIGNLELLNNIAFTSTVDSDNTTFPKKCYIARIKFSDIYANFPNSVVDLKLVNKSTGKLIIDVYLNDETTKICRILPKSQARLQWVDDTIDPLWLVTKSSDLETVESAKPSNNFLKAVVGINSDGTIKTNYSWIGLDQSGNPAISFIINHTASSGIYDITWVNNNSYDSNVIYSPVVVPTLMLTSADTDEYKIYMKDVTTGGCSIHIKDSSGYIDKDFSLMIGGHNTVDGNNFDNPFLV